MLYLLRSAQNREDIPSYTCFLAHQFRLKEWMFRVTSGAVPCWRCLLCNAVLIATYVDISGLYWNTYTTYAGWNTGATTTNIRMKKIGVLQYIKWCSMFDWCLHSDGLTDRRKINSTRIHHCWFAVKIISMSLFVEARASIKHSFCKFPAPLYCAHTTSPNGRREFSFIRMSPLERLCEWLLGASFGKNVHGWSSESVASMHLVKFFCAHTHFSTYFFQAHNWNPSFLQNIMPFVGACIWLKCGGRLVKYYNDSSRLGFRWPNYITNPIIVWGMLLKPFLGDRRKHFNHPICTHYGLWADNEVVFWQCLSNARNEFGCPQQKPPLVRNRMAHNRASHAFDARIDARFGWRVTYEGLSLRTEILSVQLTLILRWVRWFAIVTSAYRMASMLQYLPQSRRHRRERLDGKHATFCFILKFTRLSRNKTINCHV